MGLFTRLMNEQYNNIGYILEQIKFQATLPISEKFTFFNLLGNFKGKNILDLASGTGFYSRLLKKQGAAKVLGIDISETMVEVARTEEKKDPLGNRPLAKVSIAARE